MGIFVAINSVEALHTDNKVETAIGDQNASIALTTGILQISGALAEFFFIFVIYNDFKYLRELIADKEDTNKEENP